RHVLAPCLALRARLLVDLVGAFDGPVEQWNELGGIALARGQRFAVRSANRAKGNVLEVDSIEARPPRCFKEVLEVQRLAEIDDVKDRARLPVFQAIPDRREVRSRISKGPILFPD